MTTPNEHLLPEVRERVEALDKETALAWGGGWADGRAVVTEAIDEKYNEHTAVRSVEDAMQAFRKYTTYWSSITAHHEPDHDTAVILPCGAQKPIGSSAIHRKKLNALARAGWADDMDILVMSEPCTIIPHGGRLQMPAVNYDFPPEYTEEDRAPEVFDTFVARLSVFFDAQSYDTVYPYLVERHQNKFDAAVERMVSDIEVVEVPGASYNPETGSYCGDMFQTTENITRKLRAVRGEACKHTAATRFYSERDEYAVGA